MESYNPEIQNTKVQIWGGQTTSELKGAISMMGIRHTGKFLSMLKVEFKKYFGVIERIGWKIPRYAIFVEKGLGKGVGMRNGIRYETAKSSGAMFRRMEKPWFSSVIDSRIPELASLVAKERADQYIKSIKIN